MKHVKLRNWIGKRWSNWMIAATLMVVGGFCAFFGGLMWLVQPRQAEQAQATADLVIIPGPTLTSTLSHLLLMPTPTEEPLIEKDGISVGAYVQIVNTDGMGLRIRSGPGTDYPPRFLGMDVEGFEVKDGPKEADGFTWWYLVSPYDVTRSGWAASAFLSVIEPEEP